ncbi:hypothetical protein OUZ56_003982 [Daphnia magna]|uniref:Secreted protein n=1 Tax=Daphnia magna TaxID=35525 RepID=A0ABQ9YNE2_9CRUS|nr:hypothetical protein OUZ56_003982 [Daphnia magna]
MFEIFNLNFVFRSWCSHGRRIFWKAFLNIIRQLERVHFVQHDRFCSRTTTKRSITPKNGIGGNGETAALTDRRYKLIAAER